MGQLVLLIVAAAWAAVLVPPLLRSRLENRPNSSVLDFRNQLASLQQTVPGGRGVAVRTMGRSLAPSMLSKPAAPGRPNTRDVRTAGVVSSRIEPTAPAARPTRRDARAHEASLRPRQHGGGRQSATATSGSRAAEAKRRRANVLFVLVLTAICAGFLAATTESKAMVYLFALSMVALGGYVYLLVTLNQQQMYRARSDAYGYQRAPQPRRRQQAPGEVDEVDDRYDRYDRYEDDLLEETRPARRPARSVPAATAYDGEFDIPGNGTSGRISYGRGQDRVQPRRDPRDPSGRDAYGWESGTHEIVRSSSARNGRHATGQVPVQRRRQLRSEDERYYLRTR